MAKDDGSEVAITEQSVQHWVPDIGYVHYIKVCNKTDKVQTVYVQSNPYETDKNKNPVKIGKDVGEHISIPANKCHWLTFTFDKKITQYYTDVYKSEDGEVDRSERHHYSVGTAPAKIKTVICLASLRPQHIHRTIAIAYPRSLEVLEGEALMLQVTGIRGLRDDWTLLSTYPKIHSAFKVHPNQKSIPFTFEIALKDNIPSPFLTDVVIDVAVKGKSAEPPYTWSINVPFVHKTEPPKLLTIKERLHQHLPRLILECEIEDEMDLLDSPAIRYSDDDGATWKFWGADLTHIIRSSPHGIGKALFEFQIPLKSRRSTILASILLKDTVGNESPLPIMCYPQRKPK